MYGFVERGRIPALLSAFDFSSPDQHAPLRFVTTVPQQALFFLNSPFVMEQAVRAAGGVKSREASDQVVELYRSILGRSPAAASWRQEFGLWVGTRRSWRRQR